MSFKERYLRGDCSIDMVNDYVEMWHGEGEIKKTLSEFLGLSQEEYVCWMKKSSKKCRAFSTNYSALFYAFWAARKGHPPKSRR